MMKRLLTCLFALTTILGVSANNTWPIIITKADGLPGKYAGANYSFTSEVYNFDEAVTTLRLTVISTNTVEAQTTGADGYSSGWGTGFPFFTMSELYVLDENGESIEYVATSNAAATNDGSIANLNNKNRSDHFHSTYSKGECPQEYHYVELELATPVKSFSLKWDTRNNFKNCPTYVGVTPGTDFLPYPDQEFELGEQVTTLEGLADENSLYVIEGNAPEYIYPDYDRTIPTKGGYFHSPYGAACVASAASLVRLIPDADNANSYKIYWVNNDHYVLNQTNTGWLNWTNVYSDAGSVLFTPCDSVEGDFVLTLNDSLVISNDALGKMATALYVDSMMLKRSRPNAWHFTIHKASLNGVAIAGNLAEVVADAEERIEMVGGYIEEYDRGEYEALTNAIAKAKAAMSSTTVSAAEVLSIKVELEELIPVYSILGINVYIDSLDAIASAIEDEKILLSEAPDWIEGSYPTSSESEISDATNAALAVLDNYVGLADIDAGIAAAKAAIEKFWNSKITNVKSLPFRIGLPEDGMPGELQSYGGYKWESPTYRLTGETSSLRFTVIETNNAAKYASTIYPFATWGEFELYDGDGNKIELTADDFKTNSVVIGDGDGLPALCDNNYSTHYHSAWSTGQCTEYDENPTWVYIEVSLPESISSFKYIQYGRKNGVNTPIDMIIGYGDEDVDPNEIMLPYKYNVELGEQITDPSQIESGAVYAVKGLFSCDPVDYLQDVGVKQPHYFSAHKVYGETLLPPATFFITSTGDEDGSFYIRSLKDGSYWRSTTDDNGWGAASSTDDIALAAKVKMAASGNPDLPGSLVLYEYNDTMKRDVDGEVVSTPYLIFQDWGSALASFSVTGLDMNDPDGEGEWYIYKVNMDKPNSYRLSELMVNAKKYSNLQVGTDPGYYSLATAGAFAEAYSKGEQALASGDETLASEVVEPLNEALKTISDAAANPVEEGIYVFENAYDEFVKQQGVSKVIYVYDNNDPNNEYIGESLYKAYWSSAPEDIRNAHERYQFQLISAKDSEIIKTWREEGRITETDSLNAYWIKHVETGHYLVGQENYSRPIGTSADMQTPFIVRTQGEYVFDLYCPCGGTDWLGYRSLHLGGHSGGAGISGSIFTWNGSDGASKFYLRRLDNGNSIDDNIVVNGNVDGDEVVSVTYYTVGGAVVDGPVKGINIVKTVYANGVVKTEKMFVK